MIGESGCAAVATEKVHPKVQPKSGARVVGKKRSSNDKRDAKTRREVEYAQELAEEFILAMCEIGPDFFVPKKEINQAWRDWLEKHFAATGERLLYSALKEHVPGLGETSRSFLEGHIEVYTGIRLGDSQCLQGMEAARQAVREHINGRDFLSYEESIKLASRIYGQERKSANGVVADVLRELGFVSLTHSGWEHPRRRKKYIEAAERLGFPERISQADIATAAGEDFAKMGKGSRQIMTAAMEQAGYECPRSGREKFYERPSYRGKYAEALERLGYPDSVWQDEFANAAGLDLSRMTHGEKQVMTRVVGLSGYKRAQRGRGGGYHTIYIRQAPAA